MEIESNQKQKRERSRNRWTPELDKVLADLVIKQIQSGNRQNNVFDRKIWNHIRDEFNEQTDLNFNNNQLRKHLDVLRQRYNMIKSSHVENEFIIEDSECILGFDLWEDFGVQPRNEPVKVKESPIFEQLCTIFGDDSAEGKYAQSSHFTGVSMAAQENINSTDRKRKRKPDSGSGSSQIDLATFNTMASTLSDIASGLKSRIDDSKTREDRFSIRNCINVLDEIEDLDESVYFEALDVFENSGFRETFMCLKSNKLRLIWLHGKCR